MAMPRRERTGAPILLPSHTSYFSISTLGRRYFCRQLTGIAGTSSRSRKIVSCLVQRSTVPPQSARITEQVFDTAIRGDKLSTLSLLCLTSLHLYLLLFTVLAQTNGCTHHLGTARSQTVSMSLTHASGLLGRGYETSFQMIQAAHSRCRKSLPSL